MHPELTQFQNWIACQYPHSSVRKHYKSDLALFFSYAGKPPSAITFRDVDDYIRHCLAKGLSPLTVNRRLSSLRTFYYFLSIVNDVSVPCPVIPERHFLRKPQPLPRDASEEQIRILFAHIHSPRDHAMFTLMLECGLRVGEVCNLSFEDVFLDAPPRLRIHGKGDQHRIVYLLPPAWEALQDWLISRPVRKDRAVFISEHGKRLTVSGIQYLLREYCAQADIHVTPHQLRHTCATLLLNAGMSIFALQSLLGHRHVDTTLNYARLYDETVANQFLEARTQGH